MGIAAIVSLLLVVVGIGMVGSGSCMSLIQWSTAENGVIKARRDYLGNSLEGLSKLVEAVNHHPTASVLSPADRGAHHCRSSGGLSGVRAMSGKSSKCDARCVVFFKASGIAEIACSAQNVLGAAEAFVPRESLRRRERGGISS
jgi:hypothetical protein